MSGEVCSRSSKENSLGKKVSQKGDTLLLFFTGEIERII